MHRDFLGRPKGRNIVFSAATRAYRGEVVASAQITYPAVMQATIGGTICKPGWTEAVRPPFRVMDQIKRDKLHAAGWTDSDKTDLSSIIIPLSLGGSPDDPNNFQLKPANEVVESESLQACLPRLVCERRLMLDEARNAVWRDWRAALKLCRD